MSACRLIFEYDQHQIESWCSIVGLDLYLSIILPVRATYGLVVIIKSAEHVYVVMFVAIRFYQRQLYLHRHFSAV